MQYPMTKTVVWDFEFWLLVLIWNLVLGICSLKDFLFWLVQVGIGDLGVSNTSYSHFSTFYPTKTQSIALFQRFSYCSFQILELLI